MDFPGIVAVTVVIGGIVLPLLFAGVVAGGGLYRTMKHLAGKRNGGRSVGVDGRGMPQVS